MVDKALAQTVTILLLIGAVLAAAVGMLLISQATAGVGLIGIGCLCGILARIVQAALYEKRNQSRTIPSRSPVETNGLPIPAARHRLHAR
jgi:hypothetical protein